MNEKYIRIFLDGFVSMDNAENILVIKTVSGMAMAVAAAMDHFDYPEVVGVIAGFIASKLTSGSGKGCLTDLILGVIGGAVGGWLFDLLGISVVPGLFGEILVAVVGAALVLWLWKRIS